MARAPVWSASHSAPAFDPPGQERPGDIPGLSGETDESSAILKHGRFLFLACLSRESLCSSYTMQHVDRGVALLIAISDRGR